jgi:NADH-quinone oxidoreductase subunit G
VIEGLTHVNRHSVIAQGKYPGLHVPKEFLPEVMDGRKPKLLMDIHEISEVNKPEIDLSEIPGPPTSKTFGSKQ